MQRANAIEGEVELLDRRRANSKLFRRPDGKLRQVIGLGQRLHYAKDGKFEDIDLTDREDGDNRVIDKAPYVLRVAPDRLGYRYTSQSGKVVLVELVNAGRGKVNVPASYEKKGNAFEWAGVAPSTDYRIIAHPNGVATELVLHGPDAPRQWAWRMVGDGDLIAPIRGWDAEKRHCEIRQRFDEERGLLIAEWTGRVASMRGERRRLGAKLGSAPLPGEEIAWPVTIDPTVTETIQDDAWGFYSGGFYGTSNYIYVGRALSTFYSGAFRWTGITVPQGVTVTSATLTVEVAASNGNVEVRAFCEDVDSAGNLGAGDLPFYTNNPTSAVTDTSISGTGSKDIDITSSVQEVINRGGWSSGNNMVVNLATRTGIASGDYLSIESENLGGGTPATLEIIYAAPATPRSQGFMFG